MQHFLTESEKDCSLSADFKEGNFLNSPSKSKTEGKLILVHKSLIQILNKVTRSSLVTPDSMEKGEEYFRL
jgi:hypothetical protein